MPRIVEWAFEEIISGEIRSQLINFSIDDHDFVMIFTQLNEFSDNESIAELSSKAGFDVPANSYDVKFDRIENFDSGDYYSRPSERFSFMDFAKMRRLGLAIYQVLEFHITTKEPQAYFASAENIGLKWFYDRLVKQYADRLNLQVISDLGEEGLDYAIKTSKY